MINALGHNVFNMDWIAAKPVALIMVCVSALGIYIALLIFTRLSGLRSFSKLSSFDFAITIAFGSIIASVLMAKSPSLIQGGVALAILFAIQFIVSRSRVGAAWVRRLVDNEPLLIMSGKEIQHANLKKARMTEADLIYKLRLAGVSSRDQVQAVIFESTGDVSVLQNDGAVDPWLFTDVRGAEAIDQTARD